MPFRYNAPPEGWNQNKQRSLAVFYDQHRSTADGFPDGRPWWAYTERPAEGGAAAMPVGDLIPYGWDAPWTPESKYMQLSIHALSGNRFRIAYERMIIDYRQALDEYYIRAATEAVAVNLPIPEHGEPVQWKLAAIVGAPPKSSRIPEAALAGDRWLLGFTKQPNEQLARLIATGDSRIARPVWTPIDQLPNAERDAAREATKRDGMPPLESFLRQEEEKERERKAKKPAPAA